MRLTKQDAIIALLAALLVANGVLLWRDLASDTAAAPAPATATGGTAAAPAAPAAKPAAAAVDPASTAKSTPTPNSPEDAARIAAEAAKTATGSTTTPAEPGAATTPASAAAPAAAAPAAAAPALSEAERLAADAAKTVRPPTGDSARKQRFNEEEAKEYDANLELYRNGKYEEAYLKFRAMAARQPKYGVLGMIVASLASTHPSEERIKALIAEAEAHPDSHIDNFVAGVGAHYYAHQSGRTKEEKAQYYRTCIEFLDKTRPHYDFEPRTFIYLAVSNFRLGNQKAAEEYIEKAVTLADDDPDAFYCRAEIFQRANVQRSLDDLQKYLDMTVAFRKQGAVLSEAKEARVRAMRDHLIAVSKGDADPTELFDPVEAEKQAQEAILGGGGAPSTATTGGVDPSTATTGGAAPDPSTATTGAPGDGKAATAVAATPEAADPSPSEAPVSNTRRNLRILGLLAALAIAGVIMLRRRSPGSDKPPA